jgi:hypothetical protein
MIQEAVFALAQTKIDSGVLPATHKVTTLGGLSTGAICATCDLPIRADAAELEIEWSRDGQRATARLHPACYAVWSEAVDRRRTDD